MDEKVSVIIPTLNEGNNIKTCVESLINQTEKPLEILIIDNGSGDNTLEISKNLKKKVGEAGINLRVYYHPYGNQINARGVGAKKSKGEIIASIDADAMADENWILEIKKHFKDPEIVGIGGKSFFRNRGIIMNFFYSLTYPLRLISNLYCIGGGNSAFRRSTFFSVNGYNGLEKLRKKENITFEKDDFFLSKRLEQKGKLKFCPKMKVTLLYRVRTDKNKSYKKIISFKELIKKVVLGTIYDVKIKNYFKNLEKK